MIVKVIEEIENKVKHFFLNDVSFVINKKVVKKGKLVNAFIKDFFIIFKIQIQKGGIKSFEVPYPFSMEYKPTKIIFDYKINTLATNDPVTFVKIKNFKPKKNSKFYDVQLIIQKENI